MRISSVLLLALSLIACRTKTPDDDEDGFDASTDCDDADAAVNPGATEVCNAADDNCNGTADDGATDATVWYLDSDADDFGNTGVTLAACDQPSGYVAAEGDCDDAAPEVHPGAEEDCENPVDNNCDGSVGYADADSDGWAACEECDDGDAAISPAAVETCDDADNDCDGDTDEDGALGGSTFYADTDGDGFGDADAATLACSQPAGSVSNADDCDDTAAAVMPGAAELCNDLDENCNGVVDEDPTDATVWYLDADADGAGGSVSTKACDAPDGYVATDDDCDDLDPATEPNAVEICDEKDNNCDGAIPTSETAPVYADSDGDGHGNKAIAAAPCTAPTGYVASQDDCDDVTAATYPGATEVCDNKDNDCNGAVPTAETTPVYADADGDGHGNAAVASAPCTAPSGYVASKDDCNDVSAASYPGATEICDAKDNDCDGAVPAPETDPLYLDGDDDGFGNPNVTSLPCNAPSNYIDENTDCNDTDPNAYPGAVDLPGNAKDDDCKGDGDWHPTVYTVDRYSGAVWAIDRVTRALVWTADTNRENIDITVGPDGTIYTDAFNIGGILKINPTTRAVTTLVPSGLPGIHGLNYDFANNVVIATANGNSNVYAVNPTTGALTTLAPAVPGGPIDAIRFAGDPRIYITTRATPAIVSYTPSTGTYTTIVTLPEGPNLITPSLERGKIFTTSSGGSVYEVDLRRRSWRQITDTNRPAYGNCADPLPGNDLLLGDHTTALWTYDTTSGASSVLRGGLGQTWGCANDSRPDVDGDSFVNRALGGTDCNDLDAAVRPTAIDTADGVDQNCDGVDGVDGDGDGSPSVATGGGDCNDADPNVFLGKGCTGAVSCLDILNEATVAPDGIYSIDPSGTGAFNIYCDMTTEGGGWSLVWKHSYYEVGVATNDMRFYTQTNVNACTSPFGSWCNVPRKLIIGLSEERVRATYVSTTVWDFVGTLNPNIDSDVTGGRIDNWRVLTDRCSNASNGWRPEPETGAGHVYDGVTWDKANNFDYTSNCDTDRYTPAGTALGTDCRWENCGLPSSISSASTHVQMTVTMWVR